MIQETYSPRDGVLIIERELLSPSAASGRISKARCAFSDWSRRSLADRTAVVERFLALVSADKEALALELTTQMGRPISQTPYEIDGFVERGQAMIELAPEALSDVKPAPITGFNRFIQRVPLGVVLVLSPWNYPWLCAVNVLVPALLAGNTVLLKHSDQTPLVAERIEAYFLKAGGPEGVLQHIHMSHQTTAEMVAHSDVDYVAFTGSVAGGRAVHSAAAGHFKAVGLELGGKDPAYVRPDADLEFAARNITSGALYNSGQSCCAVERVFVHADVYDSFVEKMASAYLSWQVGDPFDPGTKLGPVVRPAAAAAIRAQIQEATAGGAQSIVENPASALSYPTFVAPQLLVGVTTSMALMREETFGPVVGVMKVESDDEAVQLMNDSDYGLTASLWTSDQASALAIGTRLETGTVFQNRCDYLDPALAWVGVKSSGRGASLSRIGLESLTRPKSFHLRALG